MTEQSTALKRLDETYLADLRDKLEQLTGTLEAASQAENGREMGGHLAECQALAGEIAGGCQEAANAAEVEQRDEDMFAAHIRVLIACSGHSLKVVQGE